MEETKLPETKVVTETEVEVTPPEMPHRGKDGEKFSITKFRGEVATSLIKILVLQCDVEMLNDVILTLQKYLFGGKKND